MLVTDLQIQKRNKDRVNLFLDNEFKCGLSKISILDYRIKIGDELSESKLQEVLTDSETQLAFDKSINLLSKFIKTSKQIERYLKEKEFDDTVIQATIGKLKSYKYIDDEDYVDSYLHCSETKGKIRLKQELLLKGIDRQLVDLKLAEFVENTDVAYELALKFLKSRELNKETLMKLNRYLLSRGYNYDIIRQILNKLKIEYDE